jgi:hypothetical protein
MFSSCKKTSEKPSPPPPPPTGPVVDIGGDMVDSNGHIIGGIWRNGVFTASPDSSAVISLSYSGKDLYALGRSGAYWKFGTHTVVHVSYAGGQILANGTDVYITLDKLPGNRPNPDSAFGIYGYNAGYWKNGQAIDLSQMLNLNMYSASIGSISVSGTDLYLGGLVQESFDSLAKAVYWKNNTIHYLPGGQFHNFLSDEFTRFISVIGNNVYNALRFLPADAYWVNDDIHYLGDVDEETMSGMAVSDTDVYIIGYIVRLTPGHYVPAFIYKNGQRSDLVGGDMAFGIAVSGTDVYVVGRDLEETSNKTVYWKNGQVYNLGLSDAYCIVVEP